jgi:hypothetical protein
MDRASKHSCGSATDINGFLLYIRKLQFIHKPLHFYKLEQDSLAVMQYFCLLLPLSNDTVGQLDSCRISFG